jgi:hypothetical protein
MNSSSSLLFDGKDLDYFTRDRSQTEVRLSEIQIDEIYEKCQKSLNNADIQLKAMKELDKHASYLKMISYEPNPDLFLNFKNVYRSSLALNNGSRALIILICQMLLKKENIIHQLNHLLFMIKHLFLITSKSDSNQPKIIFGWFIFDKLLNS